MYKKIISTLFIFVACVAIASKTHAATLNLLTEKDTYKIGDTFILDVKIDSEDQGINGAQATISFDGTMFEATKIDKSDSIFDFWLANPTIATDRVNFIAAATTGFNGKSLEALRITFKTKSAGKSDITITDAAITASDGSGTNVLSKTNNVSISIATTAGKTAPTQITRVAETAVGLPAKPDILVPFYPDPKKWNNVSDKFFVSWKLPSDVTDVAAIIDKNSTAFPTKSDGLFTTEQFGTLSDGINFLHVRFKNNIGWGPVANYQIAIDTQPPHSFTLSSDEGLKTEIPTPTLHAITTDALSGIKEFVVRIDGTEAMRIASSSFNGTIKLPQQKPGTHRVVVSVFDNAGNSSESSISIEIQPIASPVITFVTKDVFYGENKLAINGTSIPNIKISLALKDKFDSIISSTQVTSDSSGNWSGIFNDPLKKGTYTIEATAQDERGASSLLVTSETISVKEKPILTLGGIEITQFWFFIGLILIIVAAFLIGWFSYSMWKKQVGRKIVIAQRDALNVFAMMEKDIEKLLKNYVDGVIDNREASEMEYLLKKMKENIAKTKKYIIENINQINE